MHYNNLYRSLESQDATRMFHIINKTKLLRPEWSPRKEPRRELLLVPKSQNCRDDYRWAELSSRILSVILGKLGK